MPGGGVRLSVWGGAGESLPRLSGFYLVASTPDAGASARASAREHTQHSYSSSSSSTAAAAADSQQTAGID